MRTTKIEMDFKDLLCNLKAEGVTAEAIQMDQDAKNQFSEKAGEFLRKVVLLSNTNRNLIFSTGYPFDMYMDSSMMRILLKLDKILALSDDRMIPYVVRLVNNVVINLVREWYKTYPTVEKPSKDSDMPADSNTNRPAIIFPNDETWNMMADDTNIEEELIEREQREERHNAFLQLLTYFSSCSRFQLVCLLATKVLFKKGQDALKTSALANAIHTYGLMAVSKECFRLAAKELGIPESVFSSFTHDEVPSYSSHKELCSKISNASYRCACKLCKKLGATRLSQNRVHR